MVWTCFEKTIGFRSGGKKRARATKYDVEETSGGAYQSDWTEKGGCHSQSEVA